MKQARAEVNWEDSRQTLEYSCSMLTWLVAARRAIQTKIKNYDFIQNFQKKGSES